MRTVENNKPEDKEDRETWYPYDVSSFVTEIKHLKDMLVKFTPEEVDEIAENEEVKKFTWMLGYKPGDTMTGFIGNFGHLTAKDYEERLKEK
jgi:hypothetical protein